MIGRPFLLLAVLALASCERGSPDPATVRRFASKALTGVLAYPQSRLAGIAAGTEAAEVTLTTPSDPERVVSWYRETLHLNQWELKSDARQPDGAVVIHAVKDGRPLWVTIRPTVGAPGSTYSLVGVVLEGDSIR